MTDKMKMTYTPAVVAKYEDEGTDYVIAVVCKPHCEPTINLNIGYMRLEIPLSIAIDIAIDIRAAVNDAQKIEERSAPHATSED